MEKAKNKILIFSLFLMLNLLSFTKSYSPQCPENYFVKPLYSCVSCKSDQYLDFEGNCQCKEKEKFFNYLTKECVSCPADSTYDETNTANPTCICNKNENKTIFNRDFMECEVPTEFDDSDNIDCNPYQRKDSKTDPTGYCYDCPAGQKRDPNDDEKCTCDSGYHFSSGKCIKDPPECNDGEEIENYDGEVVCVKCDNGTAKDDDYNTVCACSNTTYFNRKQLKCLDLPANSIKYLDFTESNKKEIITCIDNNAVLDLENNECNSNICVDEDAFPYITNDNPRTKYECLCKDFTKYYNDTQKKCVSCPEYQARSDFYYSNECDTCTENHFKHYFQEEGKDELSWECKKCPEDSNIEGCFCKKPFETFDSKREKCFACGKGAHINEDSFNCACDEEDEFYDNIIKKCRKCPAGSIVSNIPLFPNSNTALDYQTCVCPPNQIYDRKNNVCLDKCEDGQTFDYECSPCPEGSYGDGYKTYCDCDPDGDGIKEWDYETQTCKIYGEWSSSSSFMKFCFGLILLTLLL